MSGQQRPERSDGISAGDAERLLAGVLSDGDDRPLLTTLHEVLAAARRPAEHDELAQMAEVVAAFKAVRSVPPRVVPRRDHGLRATARRTAAIIGLTTGASLTVAFATGAVGNPFVAPPPVEHGPGTTTRPLVSSLTVSSDVDPSEMMSNEPAAVDSWTGDNGQASTGRAGTQPEAAPIEGEEGEIAPSTPPGQVAESPSITAPGPTGPTSSVTTPGPLESPPVTVPRPVGSPPLTVPRPVEPPSATVPAVVAPPPVTAPGRVESPSVTAPGRVESPSVTAPGTGGTPAATAPGQLVETPTVTTPGFTGQG
jgi:hypothetical protein